MTAIAGLRLQTLFGERPFTGADRSLARKSASDAFGSLCTVLSYVQDTDAVRLQAA